MIEAGRRLSAAVLVIFAIAACGGSQGGGKTDTSPIKIGFIVSLTGTFAANGKNEQNGWNLAQKQLGDTVNGRKIQTVFADDQTDPNVALSDARDLVERDGVVMLQGPIPANAIGAVASYAGPHRIPVDDITLCSDVQIKSYKQFGNAYASSWSCDQPSLMMGQWLYDQGYRHITTVGLDYAFGWLGVGSLMASFKKAGGSIDKSIWAPISTADFSPYVPQIPQKTDAVFALMAGAASVKFTSAYRQLGLKDKIPLVGNTTLTDYSALPAMDAEAALGIRITAQYCDAIDSPENSKFANDYKSAYGVYPGYYSDAGYTKYRLLLSALQKLNGNTSDSKKLVSTLKSTAIRAPRGPVKLSTATNSPVENIYICEVKRVGSDLRNVPIKTFKDVQPWGNLDQKQWLDVYAKNATTRPTG
ncbi:MAG: ABC transporter substrate-binding protein [Candidatus Dormibacteraeota bacterium]|uniref:ABC transporter substrate-binding protein n=1 Tax=Candidatus Dormiibacter inghamiae TaxID=3127013 RepID=A0A934KKQ0_9BACT|nr:ABC transporter substrate-binding protein [Candidatus Dormibacteraeota bacterium]MBJ7606161.1 ABC transporter substrate-binding protein [Candidatus Dormibacteraeota bacterium]